MGTFTQGQIFTFLDYEIKYTSKSDGLVLYHKKRMGHECHLGNFGHDEIGLDNAKKAALIHFMIMRPSTFAQNLAMRILSTRRTGTYMDWYLLNKKLKEEGFKMPDEITCSEDGNSCIQYKGDELIWKSNN